MLHVVLSLAQYLEDFKIFCEQHVEIEQSTWDMEYYLDVMESLNLSFHVITRISKQDESSSSSATARDAICPAAAGTTCCVESKPCPPSQIYQVQAGLTEEERTTIREACVKAFGSEEGSGGGCATCGQEGTACECIWLTAVVS